MTGGAKLIAEHFPPQNTYVLRPAFHVLILPFFGSSSTHSLMLVVAFRMY